MKVSIFLSVLYFILFTLYFILPSPALGQDSQCTDDLYYLDGNSCIHKTGGYFDETINDCVYAYDEVSPSFCAVSTPTPTLTPTPTSTPTPTPTSTLSPTPTLSPEEEAVYNLNQGTLPKELASIEAPPPNFLQSFLNRLINFLSSLFFWEIVDEPKMYAQSDNIHKSEVPEEVSPTSQDPLIQMSGFLGGSAGFYGVSLPPEVQSGEIKQSETSFEQAYFPEGIHPITGQ